MLFARLGLRLVALIVALALGAYIFAYATGAQENSREKNFQPDLRRALATRTRNAKQTPAATRADGYTPRRAADLKTRAERARTNASDATGRTTARAASQKMTTGGASASATVAPAAINTRIRPGTSLGRVLHTSQLSINSSAGSVEQFADANANGVADERATFDTCGGAFDISVGLSGTRYEVYSALDNRGTSNPNDDRSIGVLVTAPDANGDYTRDGSCSNAALTYDLYRDFGLPSAVSVVSGTSRAGREFAVVSSSGYYNFDDPNDPGNEPSAGVVLVVRDSFGGVDFARSRTLVAPGGNQLNNANALALLPNNDLVIADFDSDELRIVRDRDADGMPDTLDPEPYYSYQFSNDAPVDIAANSRGVVFSHSVGNNTVMLALYDTNANGYADAEEVVVEGLSIDNNLILHGLTVDREGTVYVVEDATGAADVAAFGGNGGTPLVDAFPDPALNGVLRDGTTYVAADNPTSQALSGLAFGTDATLRPVARLSLTNSASSRGDATRDGLATILGAGLTEGRRGASASEASARGVRVTIEGVGAPVHSFADDEINIYVPASVGTGTRSVVVSVDGRVVAAEDVAIVNANPGLFTTDETGAGEAVALLASGMRYTPSPFPARFDNRPSVVALFGTGWRNSLPVTVTVGGRAGVVEFAGADENFPGLDQLNVRIPDGTTGTVPVVVRTSNGAASRSDVVIKVN